MEATPIKERTSCYRVFRLLLAGGKRLQLQFIIENIQQLEPPFILDTFLFEKKSKIDSYKCFNKEQCEILYPKTGKDTDTEQWDITLAATIIRTLLRFEYGKQRVAVDKISDLRNGIYAHIGDFRMSDDQFKTNWIKVRKGLRSGAMQLLDNSESLNLAIDNLVKEIRGEEVRDVQKMVESFCVWNATETVIQQYAGEGQDDPRDQNLNDQGKEIEELRKNHEELCRVIDRIDETVRVYDGCEIPYCWHHHPSPQYTCYINIQHDFILELIKMARDYKEKCNTTC